MVENKKNAYIGCVHLLSKKQKIARVSECRLKERFCLSGSEILYPLSALGKSMNLIAPVWEHTVHNEAERVEVQERIKEEKQLNAEAHI